MKVKQVKQVENKLINQLFEALAEANNSDSRNNPNDLHNSACNQNDLYGHLGDAIKCMGYLRQYDQWVDTGEIPTILDRRDQ